MQAGARSVPVVSSIAETLATYLWRPLCMAVRASNGRVVGKDDQEFQGHRKVQKEGERPQQEHVLAIGMPLGRYHLWLQGSATLLELVLHGHVLGRWFPRRK